MADQDDKKVQPLEAFPSGAAAGEKPAEVPVELSADSQNVLDAFNQANIEVADMPESNELQERRKKTKNRLRELSEMGEPDEGGSDGEAFEREEGGLMDLLREANLSKRQLGFCCGGVLVLLILVGLIYGGFKAWSSMDWKIFDAAVEEPASGGETPVSAFPDASLTAGMMLGQSSGVDGSTGLGEDLGANASSEDELTQLIVDFSKMFEAMQVDVNELLDQSTDRSATLAEYERQLNYLLYVGQQNSARLEGESAALEDQYAAMEAQKDAQEEWFFDKLRHLDAYASAAALDSFVADGQEIVKLRAHYQARQKLLGYYTQVMENLSARIEDIQLNERPLLEGIQVVDIEGSDIDLIIDGSDL